MSNLIYFQGEMAHLFFFLKEALTRKCANFSSIYIRERTVKVSSDITSCKVLNLIGDLNFKLFFFKDLIYLIFLLSDTCMTYIFQSFNSHFSKCKYFVLRKIQKVY